VSLAQTIHKVAREAVAETLANAITFKAKLNKSGKSYYVYLPRRYNKLLKKWHEERREVKVIVIPEP